MARNAPQQGPKCLRYFGTLNNPTEQEYNRLVQLSNPPQDPEVAHLAWQFEKAPTTGTPHIQIFLILTNRKRLAFVTQLLGTVRTQWKQIRPGSKNAHMSTYCQKDHNDDGTPARLTPAEFLAACPWIQVDVNAQPAAFWVGPFVVGALPADAGRAPGRADFAKRMRAGERLEAIALENDDLAGTFIQCHRGLRELQSLIDEQNARARRPTLNVKVFLGPAGSGKSNAAFDEAEADPAGYFSYSPSGTKGLGWFDGAGGKNTIIFDDFHWEWFSYEWFMRILDRYPLRLGTKGSHTHAFYNNVIITTCTPIEQWYPEKRDKSELLRRITSTVVFQPRAPTGILALAAGALVALPAPIPAPAPAAPIAPHVLPPPMLLPPARSREGEPNPTLSG